MKKFLTPKFSRSMVILTKITLLYNAALPYCILYLEAARVEPNPNPN